MTKLATALRLAVLVTVVTRSLAQDTLTEEVEDLLKLGDQLDFNGADDLVLLIGSTGVGKSTLTKFILRDHSLQSIQSGRRYIYIDNGTISNVTQTSMTLLPNVYKDNETGIVIVDCPGFSDTRESKYEIAASYYVKRTLEHAKRLKLVAVENHFSLEHGADRFGLTRLLKHISEMIPNIHNFNGSLALVATKVNSLSYTDEEEKRDIDNYLTSYAHELRKQLFSHRLNVTTEKRKLGILRALETIIHDGAEKNMALFRSPVSAGPPWDSEILQKCYQDIRNLIFQQTSWFDNSNQQYHFTLTAESVFFIEMQLMSRNNERILAEMSSIISSFIIELDAKLSVNQPISQKIQFAAALIFVELFDSFAGVKNADEIQAFVEILIEHLPLQRKKAEELQKLISRAQFFRDVGVVISDEFLIKVQSEIKKVEEKLGGVLHFYQFLTSLKVKLGQYKPQALRNTSHQHITKENFQGFIFDLSKFQIDAENKDKLLAIALEDYLLEDLNYVMVTALDYNITYTNQTSSHMVVQARNLLLSEINDKIVYDYNAMDTITLTADEKIFIDHSLAVSKINISIEAPIIEVIGDREILLTADALADAKSSAFSPSLRMQYKKAYFAMAEQDELANFQVVAQCARNAKELLDQCRKLNADYVQQLSQCENRNRKLTNSLYRFKEIAAQERWETALKKCEIGGMTLAIVDSYEEKYLIEGAIKGRFGSMWIGANDKAIENRFVWEHSGQLITNSYTNWCDDEPNNSYGGEREDCVRIKVRDEYTCWNDYKCSVGQTFLCEDLKD